MATRMKTPQEWTKVLIEHGVTHAATALVIDIQRDAREGMVPVDDVAYCIHNLEVGGCSEEYERGYNACAYGARALLRAKHPNLFTT